jgi:hypothetical protein
MSVFRDLLRLSVLFAASHALAISADTFLVLSGPNSASLPPATVLGSADVGERHCTPARCVVLTSAASQVSRLAALAQAHLIGCSGNSVG